MHLQQGLSTINTRKTRKLPKMTKGKLKELELRWREYNKSMKQKHLHHLRYDTLDEYIEYCYGLKKKPDPRDRSTFKTRTPETNWRAELDREHRQKYPSLMEQSMKNGTFNTGMDGKGNHKELTHSSLYHQESLLYQNDTQHFSFFLRSQSTMKL